MFHALSWFAVLSLLALWSLAAWAFHSAAAWAASNAGVVAGGLGPVEAMRVPVWLAPWIPPELAVAFTSMLSVAAPAIETLLGWAPALAGGLSVAVWAVWAIGAVLIVLLGLVLSATIALLRRRAAVATNRSAAVETVG